MPVDWGHVDPVKGVNATGFSELSSPERLVIVDLEVKYFKRIHEELPTIDGDNYVIPEDGHLLLERQYVFQGWL
jgi:hypothetical protein